MMYRKHVDWKIVDIGSFENLTGKMIISDPCYELGSKFHAILDVTKGEWTGELIVSEVEEWGKRVSALTVKLVGSKAVSDWQKQSVDLGVDSGSMSIVDYFEGFGEGDHPHDRDDPNTWFEKWYAIVMSGMGGIVNHLGRNIGIVSSSGYGDGLYQLYSKVSAKGEIVAIQVVFIEIE